MTLTLRSASTTSATTKGTPLSHAEMDANWLDTPAQLAASSGSSLVGFLQSGSGAIARTVQEELRETVKVTQFGDFGSDGSVNATTLTTALNACKAIHQAGKFPELEIPAGKYRITFAKSQADTDPFTDFASKSFYNFSNTDWGTNSSFSSGDDFGLLIRGKGQVVLLVDGDANSYLFSTSNYFTLNFENITFRAYDNTATVHCLATYQLVHAVWKNVHFQDFRKGVAHYMPACTDNTFYGYYSYYNQRALVLGAATGTYGDALSNVNHFIGYEFANNGQNLTDAQSWTIGSLEVNATQNASFDYGVWQNNASAPLVKVAHGLTFRNSYFEGNNSTRTASTAYRTSLVVDPTQSVLTGVSASYVHNLAFEDCYIAGDFAAMLRAASGKTVDGITYTRCSWSGNSKFGYVSGEEAYIKGILLLNSARFTDGDQDTLETSLPVQDSIDSSDGTVLASSSARTLPIICYAPNAVLGVVANIRQSAFRGTMGAARTDVTGDGTAYTVVFGTEDFDFSANFDGTTFTAPATGAYQFSGMIRMQQLGSGHTSLILELVTTAETLRVAELNPYAISVSGIITIPFSVLVSMTAGNTATLVITVSGSTKTVDILGFTKLCGHLVA